ncbi:MAG: hypothetical protein WCC26_14880 [Terracidiphilus sp.]
MKRTPLLLPILLFALTLTAQAQTMFESPLFAPQTSDSHIDKAFKIAAWPGYGIEEQGHSRLGTAAKITLATERAAFAFDLGTTARGLSSNPNAFEGNSLNTLFGGQNRIGVLSSMTSWELGYSYTAAVVPRWFEATRWRKPVRIAVILAGAYLAEEHARMGACNIRILSESQPLQTQSCGE